jgi:ribosome-associated toxin RatA of RatAB toxin-antitoxin module
VIAILIGTIVTAVAVNVVKAFSKQAPASGEAR